MARTMDHVEQIAVTMLALAYPTRPKLQDWVKRIVADADFSEYGTAWGQDYAADSLDTEMRRSVREFATVTSAEEATELQMADRRIHALASAIIEHRHGNAYGRLSLSLQARTTQEPRGLAANIVEYTASISESAARLAMHMDDLR